MINIILSDVSGARRTIRVGKELARGGAGAVHEVVGEPAIVVKLYNADTLRGHGHDYEKKIQRMLQHAPALPPTPDAGIVQLSWPIAVARGTAGNFLGFSMPRLDFGRTEKLESLLQPKLAQKKNLRTDLGARITVAANLAGVISTIHEKGHRIVDLKPLNLQFYRQELYVAVLDCDGFEIQLPGSTFAAPQVTPEYLAPEFHGKRVNDPERQDRFALAVIIFKLLNFGTHPYSGIIKETNGPTDLEGKMAKGLYAYSVNPNPKIDPTPTSAHHCFSDEIRDLFDRAFSDSIYAYLRPTAQEWYEALHRYALTSSGLIVQCKSGHLHFAGKPCGTCHREAVLSGRPPPPVNTPVNTATSPLRQLNPNVTVTPTAIPTPTATQTATPATPAAGHPSHSPAKFVWPFLLFVMVIGCFSAMRPLAAFILALSGLYFGNQWASKRGWWRVFSIFIAMPVGGLITLIGASLYFAALEKVFNPDKKQAPTSFTPSFDCTKASNGAERLICNDRELSRLDVELNVIYQRYFKNIDAKDKKSLKANQVEWMTLKRNACSDVPCMVEAYKERINEMNNFN